MQSQDELEIFHMIKKCPDNLKNVSGYSKKSLDDVEMYIEIWKVPDDPESVRLIQKIVRII